MDRRIALVLKWLATVVAFFVIAMPAQILWFLFFPLIKIIYKKQREKTDIPAAPLDIMLPINTFGKIAKGFLEGAI